MLAKTLGWIAVIIVVLAVLDNPHAAGNLVQGFFGLLGRAGHALGQLTKSATS